MGHNNQCPIFEAQGSNHSFVETSTGIALLAEPLYSETCGNGISMPSLSKRTLISSFIVFFRGIYSSFGAHTNKSKSMDEEPKASKIIKGCGSDKQYSFFSAISNNISRTRAISSL